MIEENTRKVPAAGENFQIWSRDGVSWSFVEYHMGSAVSHPFKFTPLLIFQPFNLTFRNPPLSHIGDRSTPPFKRGVPTMST